MVVNDKLNRSINKFIKITFLWFFYNNAETENIK